ncbi:MAG: glycosyltransferase family 2 protein [Bryobacteraceae bacterium]
MVTAVAIVCVRNEAPHIKRCLRYFIREGLDVILIDNDSTDGSADIARPFLGQGLISIERLPFEGSFSLVQQLAFKKTIAEGVTHDWIVHADADEWLQAPPGYARLIDGIQDVESQGFNCVNFLEFDFIPLPGEDFEVEDYPSVMRHYYHLVPFYPFLMRAWKRSAELDNVERAGHFLTGPDIRLFPRDFILRHYIVLSEAHARRKYLGRRFAAEEIARLWHADHLLIDEENIVPRPGTPLLTLEYPLSSPLSTDRPTTIHYWQWP